MPYDYADVARAEDLDFATWYTHEKIKDVCLALRRCDYSVVASRRDAHNALLDLLNSAVDIGTITHVDLRFPEDRRFFCENDTYFSNQNDSLTNNLSFRETSDAKDTAAVTRQSDARQNNSDARLAADQGLQDNRKRFEELSKLWCGLPSNRLAVWTRRRYEADVGATWTDPNSPTKTK
jgi:hypothetical protein